MIVHFTHNHKCKAFQAIEGYLSLPVLNVGNVGFVVT